MYIDPLETDGFRHDGKMNFSILLLQYMHNRLFKISKEEKNQKNKDDFGISFGGDRNLKYEDSIDNSFTFYNDKGNLYLYDLLSSQTEYG